MNSYQGSFRANETCIIHQIQMERFRCGRDESGRIIKTHNRLIKQIYSFSSRDLLDVVIQEELEGQASGEGRRDARGSVVMRARGDAHTWR